MRRYALILLALAGCKYLDQPKKVAELEKRLDEVAVAVSELTGKPVGLKPKAKHAEEGDEEDQGDDQGKKAGKGKKGKGKDAKETKRKDKGGDEEGHGDEDHGDDEVADAPKARGDWRKREPVAADEHGAGDEHAAKSEHGAGEHGDAPASHDDAEPAAPKAPAHVHWAYEGAEGPAAWAKLDPSFATCERGERQSPVDIVPHRTEAPEVIFVYKPTAGSVVDNGHTMQVDLQPGSFIVVDGGRYDLVQFHLHTPSEHTMAGDSFPMELHLVHKNKAGKLAVVGVLFTEGESSTALASVWKGAPKAKGSAALKKDFDPSSLLPKDHSAYRYDGSLTTPPCTEGVIWHVMRRPRTEDESRIQAFRTRFGSNARPVQELGEREVR